MGQNHGSLDLILLRSAVGERRQWSGGRREASSESQPKRNARCRAADGSRRSCGNLQLAARDERAFCGTERARSRGRRGRPSAREVKQESALVAAEQRCLRMRDSWSHNESAGPHVKKVYKGNAV